MAAHTPTSTPKKRKAPAAAAPAAAAKVTKAVKPEKKSKLVRDGFTMPAPDHALIASLKGRALQAGRETKKSELLRAGLQALARLNAKALLAALTRLEPIKTGRPRKSA